MRASALRQEVRHELEALERVEHSAHLGLVELAEAGDVPPKQVARQVDPLVVGEGDLVADQEQLPLPRGLLAAGSTMLADGYVPPVLSGAVPQPRSLDGGTDALPNHMKRAQGLKLEWKEAAKCRSVEGHMRQAWMIKRGDKGPKLQGLPAEAWINLAVEVCATCAVQWDCTRFALAVDERWHTYGLDIVDLLWLKDRPNALRIIDTAEAQGVPVQVAVRRVRYPA